jgi:hypothetical protein
MPLLYLTVGRVAWSSVRMSVWKTLKTGSGGLLIAAAFHQVKQQLKVTNAVDVIAEDSCAG